MMISSLSSFILMMSAGSCNTYRFGFEANSLVCTVFPSSVKLNMAATSCLPFCSLEGEKKKEWKKIEEKARRVFKLT